jgi:purine-binding chemotaxis protein CheW
MTTEREENMENMADRDDACTGRAADVRQFVTFIAGDEVFAVDMAPVQEIIRVPEVVRVPLGAAYPGRPGQSARQGAADHFPAPDFWFC